MKYFILKYWRAENTIVLKTYRNADLCILNSTYLSAVPVPSGCPLWKAGLPRAKFVSVTKNISHSEYVDGII